MRDRVIYLSAFAMRRLREYLLEMRREGYSIRDDLRMLEEEAFQHGKVVPWEDIPENVVTIHSEVQLKDLDSNELMVLTLCFPEEADLQQDRISVLSPIGAAMLGRQEGDRFEIPVPAGKRRLEVKAILSREPCQEE